MLLGDDGDSVEVLATGPVAGGVYRCDDEGCAASGLARDGLFPKSIVRDGGVRWVSTVDADTLAARLFRSADGARWEEVRPPAGGALWPEGDVDVRMLHARGEVLLAWARTRVDGDTPRLLRSEDAGRSWGAVLSYGSWQDAAAALSVAGDGSLLLGSYRGARTWRSRDGGRTWEDASAELPAVRCAASGPDGEGGTRAYVCADHLADGLDVAAEVEGVWTPVGCLEQAEPAACAQDACGPFMELYAAASAASGESTCAEAPVAKEPCGCASGSSAGALGVLAAFGLLLQRRRERPRP
jgi:MYXO-CTERM domain-containing protein